MSRNARLGQITVLVLLLGLLGLTVGLSVVSRSLSDLKQVSYVDFGSRALAGAEGALEYGLNQLYISPGTATATCGNPATAQLSLSGIKTLTYEVCSNTRDYASMAAVSQDDVFDMDLSSVNASNIKSLDVMWKNNSAAVEAIVLDADGTIRRFAFNGVNVTANNGFTAAVPASSCFPSNCDSSYSSGSCSGVGVISLGTGNKQAQRLRVKPLYGVSDISVCGRTAGNSPGRLAALSYYTITAIATTTNGTVKKVQATSIPPYAPGLFDNVLFSGQDIAK